MSEIVTRLDNYLSTLEEEYEDLSGSEEDGVESTSLKSYYDSTRQTSEYTDVSMSSHGGPTSTEDTEMIPMRPMPKPYLKKVFSAESHDNGASESLLGHSPSTQGRRKTTLTTGSGRKMSFFAREPPKEDVPYQLYDGDEEEFV